MLVTKSFWQRFSPHVGDFLNVTKCSPTSQSFRQQKLQQFVVVSLPTSMQPSFVANVRVHQTPNSRCLLFDCSGCLSIFENFWCTLTLNLTLRSFYVSKKIFMLTGLSYRVNFPMSKIVKSPAVFNINLDRRDNRVEVTMFSCRMTDLGPFGLKNWWAKFAMKTSLIFSAWHIWSFSIDDFESDF